MLFCPWQTGQLEPLLKKFTAEEERQMKRMLQRVDILANVRNNAAHSCKLSDAVLTLRNPSNNCLRSQTARLGERGEADGGRRADVLPARHQSTDPGDAEKVQPREADHFQHLPVLPQGEAASPV